MQGDRGTAAYTNVPVGAGGTANYPASQKFSGTTGSANYPSSEKVSGANGTANYPASQGVGNGYQKTGYGNEYDGNNVKSGYGGGGAYVQPTPVSYGPDGQPIVRKKSHRVRNVVLGALAVCCCCVAL